jgi:hypothetical protein
MKVNNQDMRNLLTKKLKNVRNPWSSLRAPGVISILNIQNHEKKTI